MDSGFCFRLLIHGSGHFPLGGRLIESCFFELAAEKDCKGHRALNSRISELVFGSLFWVFLDIVGKGEKERGGLAYQSSLDPLINKSRNVKLMVKGVNFQRHLAAAICLRLQLRSVKLE